VRPQPARRYSGSSLPSSATWAAILNFPKPGATLFPYLLLSIEFLQRRRNLKRTSRLNSPPWCSARTSFASRWTTIWWRWCAWSTNVGLSIEALHSGQVTYHSSRRNRHHAHESVRL